VAFVFAAQRLDRSMSLTSACLFGLLMVLVALVVNRAVWVEAGQATEGEARPALRRNLRLIALVYAWAGMALLLAYPIVGLRWQHGWQYGFALALVALLMLIHVHRMEPGSNLGSVASVRQAGWLTGLHGLAAMGGATYVLAANKLGSGKPDWLANHVFIAGGLSVAVIGAMALYTTRKLLAPRG
jgi:hypothetical protein